MNRLLGKAFIAWCLLLVLAIVNGYLREAVLVPWIGEQMAQPLSGITLSFAVVVVTWLLLPLLGRRPSGDYWRVGMFWLGLTLAFELLLGRWMLERSWTETLAVFRVDQGNLFVLVLMISLVAPRVLAGWRGYC